jgi:hypothetical protein
MADPVVPEQLDVRVGGDVVLQVIAREEALSAQLADVHAALLARIVLKIEFGP